MARRPAAPHDIPAQWRGLFYILLNLGCTVHLLDDDAVHDGWLVTDAFHNQLAFDYFEAWAFTDAYEQLTGTPWKEP